MILAIDTCLAQCSAALWDGERAWQRSERIGIGHAERIAPMVAALLDEAKTDAGALQRVCCTVGPGSFMGVRVGISLAKGLALPRGLPTVSISTTQAISLGLPRPVTVVIDARRGQAYVERFGSDARPLAIASYAEAVAQMGDGPTVGVGIEAVTGSASTDRYPDPARMARYAAGAEAERLEPLYLRPPDAKPVRSAL